MHAHTMARSVSLSDTAFANLRREKRAGESDSDVVNRLIRTAHRRQKDPRRFVEHVKRLEPAFGADEFDAMRERMRQADIARMEYLGRLRRGEA